MKLITVILLGINILSAAITCQMVNINSQQNIIIHRDIEKTRKEIATVQSVLETGFLCMEKDINQHFEKFGNCLVDLCHILAKDIESQQNTSELIWEKIKIIHENMEILNDNIKLLHTYRG